MSVFDNISVIDPYRALVSRDATALRDCLAKGWDLSLPPGGNYNHMNGYGWLQETVANGWVEGWKILVEAFPHLRQIPGFILMAFQQIQVGIMEDLLREGLNPNVPLKDRILGDLHPIAPACMIVEGIPREINGIGESRPDVPVLEKRMLALPDLVKAYGIDAYLAHPGDYNPGDVGMGGHTIWTRALRFRRWALAEKLLPSDWETVKRQPRALESLQTLEKTIHPLNLGENIFNREVVPTRRIVWEERTRAWSLWCAILARWGELWILETDQDWTVLNDDRDWQDIITSQMNARQAFWKAWERPRQDGWTSYHALVMQADQPLAQAVLRQIVADGVEPLAWQNAYMDGVSPSALFASIWGMDAQGQTLSETIKHLPASA